MIDSHCHLDFYPEEERAGIIANATAQGITGMLTIGLRPDKWQAPLELAKTHPNIWAAMGVHPLEAGDFKGKEVAKALLETSKAPQVVALGECGLDYFKPNHPPKAKQMEIFEAHLTAARECGLPLIIHNRNADSDVEQMLGGATELKAVLHCFCGDMAFAERAVDAGFYLGFGGIITYKNAPKVAEVARQIPLRHILLETDAPFLAPTPLRGKRNEPAYIPHTAEFLARLKNISTAEVITETTANFYKLFSIGSSATPK